MGDVAKLSPRQSLYTMPIPLYKGEWMVCSGLFCCNDYLLSPTTCCAGESVMLCCAADCAGLPVPEQTPKTCGYCFLMCYPKMGCCMSIKDLLADDPAALEGIDDIKEKWIPVAGCCLGPICAENSYCLMPFTCCYDEAQFLCCASDAAFPCTDKVPMVCTLLMCCTVYPSVGCCKKVQDLYPDKMETGASAAPAAAADAAPASAV